MSALIPRRRVHLHPRWNAQSTLFELPLKRLPFTPQEVAEARTRPAVIHYIGPFKPWHYLCKHPLRGLYFEHLRQTVRESFEVDMAVRIDKHGQVLRKKG